MANAKKEEYKNKPVDFILCITVLLLLALGIIMVLSASSPSSFSETGDSYTYVKKQAVSAVIGLIAMFIISKIDYKIYKHLYKVAYIGSILLLAMVPILGTEAGGAKRWIDLGFTTFQPSELAKIGLIVFYAAYLSQNRDKLKNIQIQPFFLGDLPGRDLKGLHGIAVQRGCVFVISHRASLLSRDQYFPCSVTYSQAAIRKPLLPTAGR